MAGTSTYIIEGVEVPYVTFGSVGTEGFGYDGDGGGNYQNILNGLNAEVDILVQLANNPDFTAQQRLDFYESAIEVFTQVVGDLELHYYYFVGKRNSCSTLGHKPLRNCVKKDGHSRGEISWKFSAIYSILRAYEEKLVELISLLDQAQQQLETDLNNQQLVAQTNSQIARANQLLLAVQMFELEVREQNVEYNIRTIIVPLALFSLLAFLYYRAFVK